MAKKTKAVDLPINAGIWPLRTATTFVFDQTSARRKPELARLSAFLQAGSKSAAAYIECRNGFGYAMAPYSSRFKDWVDLVKATEDSAPIWILSKKCWRIPAASMEALVEIVGRFYPAILVQQGDEVWATRFEVSEDIQPPPYRLSDGAFWVDGAKLLAACEDEAGIRGDVFIFANSGECGRAEPGFVPLNAALLAEGIDERTAGWGFWTRHPHLLFRLSRDGQPMFVAWNSVAAILGEFGYMNSKGGKRLMAVFHEAAQTIREPFILDRELPSGVFPDVVLGRHFRLAEVNEFAVSVVSDMPIVAVEAAVAEVAPPPEALAYVPSVQPHMVRVSGALGAAMVEEDTQPVVFTQQMLSAHEEHFADVVIHELAHVLARKVQWGGRRYPVHGHRWVLCYAALATVSGVCLPTGGGDYLTDATIINHPISVVRDYLEYEHIFREEKPYGVTYAVDDAIAVAETLGELAVAGMCKPVLLSELSTCLVAADRQWHSKVGMPLP